MKIMVGIVVAVVLLAMCVGSAPPDRPTAPQLLELTTRHTEHLAAQQEQQALQNERMATLQQQWQEERDALYQQRDELEADRKTLATDRQDLAREIQREPVIAQSILQVGTLILGVLPLAVCALLLRRSQDPSESEAVAETLVADLMSTEPILFSRSLSAPDQPAGRLGPASDEPSPRLEPPIP